MMVSEQTRLQLSDDATFQTMGPSQDTVLLSLSSGYLYTCNETATAFLRALNGQRTVAEIIDALAEGYDVSLHQLHSDMVELAEQLLAARLLVELAD